MFVKKKSIINKVASLTISISIITALAIGVITLIGMLVLRANTMNVSGQLGETAATDSRNALEEQTVERLITLAENKARLSDAELAVIQNSVNMLSREATNIMQSSEAYASNPVSSPNENNAGVLKTQLLYAEGVSPNPDLTSEIALIGNMANLLENAYVNAGNFTADYVATESGLFIIADVNSNVNKLNDGAFDPRSRDWYVGAKNAEKLIWTLPYVDRAGRGMGITCAAPYYGVNNEILGVVGIGSIINDLTEIVIGSKIGETGRAFMMNSDGKVIIADDIKVNEAGETESGYTLIAQTALELAPSNSTITKTQIDGKEYFLALASLNSLDWYLVTIMEVKEAVAPALASEDNIIHLKDAALTDMNNIIFIVMVAFFCVSVLTVLLMAFVSRKFAKKLTAPISKLETGVEIIAAGNLEYKLDIHTEDEIERLSLAVNKMSADISAYIDNLQKITADKERIGAELNVAKKIQASMLPCIFPAFPDRKEFDIYATMQPAKEVGGDFYDFFLIDEDVLAVVIADVSGKGIPAALFMVIAKTLIKNNAQYGKSPKEVFETVNNVLCENNDENMFVTAFMGYLELKTGKFIYVNAGHNLPIIGRKGQKREWLKADSGFVLAGLEDMAYEEATITLNAGDELYLYTDGVTEAVNKNYDLFSDERLLKTCEKHSKLPPSELLPKIKEEIDLFASGAEQADDITMLSLLIKSMKSETSDNSNASEITIPAKLDQLENVLKFVSDKLDDYYPEASEADKANLAVVTEEIFVNIARYAYGDNKDKNGEAVVKISDDDGFSIEFSDAGTPYNPLDKPDPDITLSADEREVGGLGIFMVKAMTDKAEYAYKNGRNVFKVMKRL